jgi:cytochrome b561
MIVKFIIDLVMSILLIIAMAYHMTGNAVDGNIVHEVIGIAVFVLFFIHSILNMQWYKSIFKGKYNVRRIYNTAINLLLLLIMATLMISGILLSRTIFAFIPSIGGMFVRQLHTFAAYWGLILVGVHLGMHWGIILNSARKMTGITGTSRTRTIVLRVLAGLIAAYGVKASFDREVGSKLILYSTYGFWDDRESEMAYLLGYLSIMVVYACGTYYAVKLIQMRRNAENDLKANATG